MDITNDLAYAFLDNDLLFKPSASDNNGFSLRSSGNCNITQAYTAPIPNLPGFVGSKLLPSRYPSLQNSLTPSSQLYVNDTLNGISSAPVMDFEIPTDSLNTFAAPLSDANAFTQAFNNNTNSSAPVQLPIVSRHILSEFTRKSNYGSSLLENATSEIKTSKPQPNLCHRARGKGKTMQTILRQKRKYTENFKVRNKKSAKKIHKGEWNSLLLKLLLQAVMQYGADWTRMVNSSWSKSNGFVEKDLSGNFKVY